MSCQAVQLLGTSCLGRSCQGASWCSVKKINVLDSHKYLIIFKRPLFHKTNTFASSSTSRRHVRRQCVTEQSSTDESEVMTPTAPTASRRDHVKSSTTTTSSSTSKTGSPSVSMTTLTQPLSHTTRFVNTLLLKFLGTRVGEVPRIS